MAVTKNKQSEEKIKEMVHLAFPKRRLLSVRELTGGMCNAAYMITFDDGSKSVLKIAASNNTGFLRNENCLMDTEVEAMKLVYETGVAKVARVQFYDKSCSICDGKYFFMDAIDGESYVSLRTEFTDEEKRIINYEIGEIQKNLMSIQGSCFGFLSSENNQFKGLFEFVHLLISNVLLDGKEKEIEIGVSSEDILSKLQNDKEIFVSVKNPCLVHWDMWEGNIFVKEKHVCGIIDWERAMWGESFMDDRFRWHNRNNDFLKGFGQEILSEEEMRRIYWYDIFLYLTMMVEGAFREYEDDGQYRWVKPLFDAAWEEIIK